MRRSFANPTKMRWRIPLFFASTLFLASPQSAEGQTLLAGGDPIQIEAELIEVDISKGDALLTGNVVLAKGPLKLSCPKLELKFDASPHVSWAKGSGGIVAEVKGVRAEAPEVELDLKRQQLELRGGVKLTRGQGWLQAERATIDIATSKVTLVQVKGSIPVSPK